MAHKPIRLGIVMDPIAGIKTAKDTSFAMLLAAARRNYHIEYFEQSDLMIDCGVARGNGRSLTVRDRADDFFELGDAKWQNLGDLDVILMRKDPPFDMEFIYTTYILELAESAGALVINRPAALRDMNEKAYTAKFPHLCPPTIVTRSMAVIKAFASEHEKIVVKPLDGMGGKSIFTVRAGESNTNVILETLTDYGQKFAMAQAFVKEITDGDKRIILVDGEPAPFLLARVPSADDGRGNLVMGATGEGRPLSDRDREIAAAVGPALRENGVLFAGLDVIGGSLTEINVTSPTGVREIDKQFGTDIAADLLDAIEARLG